QLTELYTDRVVDFIKRQGDQPFFLYYAHNYPHTPFEAGEKFKGSSEGGRRGDVMQELDWGIGEMMKALEETGVADNTLVIFTSDNGATVKGHALPYRGTKFISLEGGHRVPFILHWPARIKKSSVVDVPVNATDLFPTLSEIIDLPLPADRVYDGVSLVPLIDGKPLARASNEPFFYYNCENLQAVRLGDWKLHLPRTKDQVPFWDKNKEFLNIEGPVLYNLSADKGETTDVAAQHPEVVQQMVMLAEEMHTELGEYLQRGKGQRPTGSAIPGAPIVSHEKDWDQLVEPALSEAILKERFKRHPEAQINRKVRKKKGKQ
ncbi:MAG: sulfatase-like hydrolase/transferase, partial [Coraliomargarita sp.]